jgi:hypothetical protein
MNDASEVPVAIFERIHRAFTSNGTSPGTESDGSASVGMWIAKTRHVLFMVCLALTFLNR